MMGHKNVTTTQRYLASANSEHNEYADKLGDLYGLGEADTPDDQ